MTRDLDYSIYYGRFHSDTEAHAEEVAEYLIKELAPMLPDDRHGAVLDVGCGYGFALLALRKLHFENIEGVEVSLQQAERARSLGLKVEVVEDTRSWLEARTRRFSVVMLLDVLEHVPVSEQIILLRSIRNVLEPNGRLIIQVPNANSMLAARWRYNDFTHYSSFTEHSLYFVLKNAGFDDIKIDVEKRATRPSLRLWRKDARASFKVVLRRYLVRWFWLQVFKSELSWENLEEISFELNLKAVAFRRG
jgi:SAM-dependent methyltransferase